MPDDEAPRGPRKYGPSAGQPPRPPYDPDVPAGGRPRDPADPRGHRPDGRAAGQAGFGAPRDRAGQPGTGGQRPGADRAGQPRRPEPGYEDPRTRRMPPGRNPNQPRSGDPRRDAARQLAPPASPDRPAGRPGSAQPGRPTRSDSPDGRPYRPTRGVVPETGRAWSAAGSASRAGTEAPRYATGRPADAPPEGRARTGTRPPPAQPAGYRPPAPAAPKRALPPPGSDPYAAAAAARRQSRSRIVRRTLVGALSVLVLLATGVVSLIADNAGQQQEGLTTGCAAGAICTGTTILLVGSDARVDAAGNPLSDEELAAVHTESDGGGTNTDTIMLIRIPAGGGRATAVSIPRDTWIAEPPPGPSDVGNGMVPYAPNKVNSFYGSAKFFSAAKMTKDGVTDSAKIERESANSGRRMLISVLERLTGTHIDAYAEVNLFGFYLLSNAIGGVPVCLNNAVDDSFSGAMFPAGPQEVSGAAALAFVRQRHGLPGGDLDRVRRQQAFLSGAISKVLSLGTLTDPAKLAALVDAANRSIVLSSGFNLLQLAQQMSSLSTGDVDFVTLPTHGGEPSTDKDALAVDVAEVQALFAQLGEPASSAAATPTVSGTAAGLPAGEAAAADPTAPALRADDVAFAGGGGVFAAAAAAPAPTEDPSDINAGTAACVN